MGIRANTGYAGISRIDKGGKSKKSNFAPLLAGSVGGIRKITRFSVLFRLYDIWRYHVSRLVTCGDFWLLQQGLKWGGSVPRGVVVCSRDTQVCEKGEKTERLRGGCHPSLSHYVDT